MTTKTIQFILGFLILGLLLVIWATAGKPKLNLGSSSVGNDYYATTTDANFTSSGKLLKTGSGSLGSVVVTLGSGAGIEFYDATTTSSHSKHATTSIALFKTTATAGTYSFDVEFTRGLVVVPTGIVGVASTTITFR